MEGEQLGHKELGARRSICANREGRDKVE